MHVDVPMSDRFSPVSLRALVVVFVLLGGGALLFGELTGGINGAAPDVKPITFHHTEFVSNQGVDAPPAPFQIAGLAEMLH